MLLPKNNDPWIVTILHAELVLISSDKKGVQIFVGRWDKKKGRR